MVPASAQGVGRPREFDEDAVLRSAMRAFWEKGYEATSLSDLCRCTGLHKGSLYQAFGDKHALFMRALSQYEEEQFQDVASVAFESDSPLANIRAVVGKITDRVDADCGCMVINSMVELAPHDAEVQQFVRDSGMRRRRVMADMIGKAQAAGEIRPELDPDKLAMQLMVTIAGAAATVKGILEGDEILAVLDSVIESWT